MNLKFCESITEKFDGRADVKEIVAFILRKNVFRCCNQQLYFYYRDYRYYIPIEKQNEWHVVSCFISDATQEKISHSKSDEIINKIKDNFKIQMTFNDFNRDIYCINLLNGVYDVAECKLYDEYEDEYFNYFLNVNYISPDNDMMLADYSFQQTHIDNFIDECCIIKPEYRIHTVTIYERYIEFCSANGVKSISQNLFSQKISSVKGVENKRFRSGNGESRRGFIGISVKSRGHQDSEM